MSSISDTRKCKQVDESTDRKFVCGHSHLRTSGIFVEYGEIRIHGRDEGVLIRSFFGGSEFLYRLVKALSE